VPWIKPAQRRFRDDQVPEGAEKRALYEVIRTRLLDEAYAEIGLDHFALPSDALARAVETGDLYRNFMGYTERRTSMLLGLGVSAISETADCYHQNDKVLTVYERRVREGDLPSFRGHVLTPDDRRRRERILALMTSFRVVLDANEIDDAWPMLAPLEADGLIELAGTDLRVLPAGRPFLRNVASCFDIHYRTTTPAGPVYSRAL
jgi:oxygen-independent coproporphyrinogen-3 oxidase